MKIAIFADVHGNIYALKAILKEIFKEMPDKVICAGDFINPYAGSLLVWEELKKENVTLVKGNHEGYVIKYREAARDEKKFYHTSIPFLPAKHTAKHLTAQILDEIEQLPLTQTIPGPDNQDIFVCHASPTDTRRSYAVGIDEKLAAELLKIKAPVIVSGHIHEHWQQNWQNKLLLLTGAVGIPFNKLHASEYLLLQYKDGTWHPQPRYIQYDHHAAVHYELENGFLRQGGPIGWLMFDELLSFQMRLAPFMTKIKNHQPAPDAYFEWEQAVILYLSELGRWQEIKKLLKL